MNNQFLYETNEWQARKSFIQFVNDACAQAGVAITWFSGSWIGRLQKDKAIAYIYGYIFPLNNAVVGGIMRDKTATFEVLTQQNIPAIPHFLLRRDGIPENVNLADLALKLAPLPLVIKPSMGGSGGRHVYKCETPAELQAALNNVSEGNKTIAVGPLIDISREFRVVVLDGQIKVMFEKQRQEGVWHHNLRLGALPKEVTDKKLAAELSAFALNVMDTLQARLAAVDIVQTPQGLAVMEVNSGIMLGHFSEHSPANHAQAAAVYKEIITKSLGEGPASVKIGSI